MKYSGIENGPILRRLWTERFYTVERVCELTGISISTINQVEQGGRNLSMANMYKLMDLYKVDANTILNIPYTQGATIESIINDYPLGKRKGIKDALIVLLAQVAL